MRLIATWTAEQDETKDLPASVYFLDEADNRTPATMEDFARIDSNTQSYPDVHYDEQGNVTGASFGYELLEAEVK